MKIAAAGIAIECATFSPLPSELRDFVILRGQALLARYPFAAQYDDIELFPIAQASALPGGVLRRSAYDALKREILAGLAAGGPWAGLYLEMHGAMAVEGLDDAEADFIAAVRATAGESCLISASYDLHGNLSAAVMRELDLLSAYRTAPHEDAGATRARAFDLLVACLREGLRPRKAFIPIPVLLSGERAMTLVEPGKRVYAGIDALIDGRAVLDASLLVGFAWADQERSHASAVAIGREQAAVDAAAARLARSYWRRGAISISPSRLQASTNASSWRGSRRLRPSFSATPATM